MVPLKYNITRACNFIMSGECMSNKLSTYRAWLTSLDYQLILIEVKTKMATEKIQLRIYICRHLSAYRFLS